MSNDTQHKHDAYLHFCGLYGKAVAGSNRILKPLSKHFSEGQLLSVWTDRKTIDPMCITEFTDDPVLKRNSAIRIGSYAVSNGLLDAQAAVHFFEAFQLKITSKGKLASSLERTPLFAVTSGEAKRSAARPSVSEPVRGTIGGPSRRLHQNSKPWNREPQSR